MRSALRMKGQKRKKKAEKYDRDEEHEQLDDDVSPQPPKKVKPEGPASDTEGKQDPVDEMPGIPVVRVDTDIKKPGVIFILEKASLEVGKVGKVCFLERDFGIFLCSFDCVWHFELSICLFRSADISAFEF